MSWEFRKEVRTLPKLNNPILVEGLPGLGNVGKIAVDFMIDKLGAKKLYDISSYTFPHSVFVNEKNLVELPSIELYYIAYNRKGKSDLLLLAGDVQPVDEESCYEFCDRILDIFQRFGGREIITIGGIGLQETPEKPKVFCTGNSKDIIKRYKEGTSISDSVYGVVGPIVGVTGLLLGLAQKRKIEAIALLGETLGHPMYLGIKGAREVLKVLSANLDIKLDLKALDKEIKSLETEILKRTKELSQITKETALKKVEGKLRKEVTYIG